MAIKKKPRKKGPVIAKSIVHDGIKFSSGLEKNMYIMLKKAGIKFEYEGEDAVNYIEKLKQASKEAFEDRVIAEAKQQYEDQWKPEHDGHMLDSDEIWQ
jgi:predicted Fe-Mo cluster-binding NifX family protein